MAERRKVTIERSSGNVFVDLNRPNPEERQAKVRLSVAINKIIDERGLTQAQVAKKLGVNQPKVSALQNYKLSGFSLARLMDFATALGQDVVIELRPNGKAEHHGQITVKAA
jgi:predicted XRE-type DNA-binding protein